MHMSFGNQETGPQNERNHYELQISNDRVLKVGQTTFSQSDLKVATKAVKEKLENQFGLSNDKDLTDILHQTIPVGTGA